MIAKFWAVEKVNSTLLSLPPCPFCGNSYVELISSLDHKWFYITCCEELGGCGAVTKICFSMEEAVNNWVRRDGELMRGNGNKD